MGISLRMVAALFGIFAVVLQISGAFSSRPLPDYDRTGRFLLRKPYSQQWDYMTLEELKYFYSHPRPSVIDKNFEYQLLPSSWINNRRDSVIKFGQQVPSDNAAATSSATPSSIPKLKQAYLKIWPKESRKGLLPKILPGPHPIVMNSSSLSHTVQNKINDETHKLKDASSSVSQHEDVQLKSDRKDGDVTLHEIIYNKNFVNEITTVREDTDKQVDFGKETIKRKLDDGETTEITTVHEGTDENGAVEEDKSTIHSNLDGGETSEITTVHEDTDKKGTAEGETSQNKNEEASKITPAGGKGENTDVGHETTTPLEQVISETTPDNSAGSEETVFTESHRTSTRDGQENSRDDTTETADISKTSILEETTVFVSDTTSEATLTPLPDTSPSEGTPPATHPPISPTGVTYSPVSGKSTDTSTKDASSAYTSAESKSSTSVTEVVSIVPEHVIDIPSIRKAKIAITVVFLVIGIIAVAVLAVYVFRERRKAVQYDQLTLLP